MNDLKTSSCFIACFPYYGLPLFPKECKFSFNSSLLLRDMLACISTVDHHYEYPKFQDFSYDIGCMGRNLTRIISEFLEGKEVYILFRTSLYDLSEKKTYLSGYYKVSEVFELETQILGKRKFVGITSNENVFVDKSDANLWEYKFNRGAVYSENEKYRAFLLHQIDYYKSLMDSKKNQYKRYQKKTIEWIKNLKDPRFRNKLFNECNSCKCENCYLKKKINQYGRGRNNIFHLNYIYNSNVFLTDLIDNIKKKKINYLIKGEKNVEV